MCLVVVKISRELSIVLPSATLQSLARLCASHTMSSPSGNGYGDELMGLGWLEFMKNKGIS